MEMICRSCIALKYGLRMNKNQLSKFQSELFFKNYFCLWGHSKSQRGGVNQKQTKTNRRGLSPLLTFAFQKIEWSIFVHA